MMKTVSLFLALTITLAVVKPQKAHAELPAKAKAFLTIAGYGTAGGALLGLATMAFGNSSRAVAQGASLGLYAGLLFGGYVLLAHHQKQIGTYEDDKSPYQQSSDIYGEGYQSDEGGDESDGPTSGRGGFFDRFQVMQEHVHRQSFTFQSEKRKGGQLPPLQMNLFQYNF